MPVSLHRIERLDGDSEPALMRILKDLPADDALSTVFKQWQNSPNSYQVWFAKFNDRYAAAAVVKGSIIEALVVHPATRRRGMATRFVQLLMNEVPNLSIDASQSTEAGWIDALIKKFSN